VTVIDLEEIGDDALITEVGGWAPTVGIEKLPAPDEPRWAVEALESFIGRQIDAIICAEIGGSNSMVPLEAGALTGKPVLDADAMGRAFPELQMSTHLIYGAPCTPPRWSTRRATASSSLTWPTRLRWSASPATCAF
jgi:DUF917 family protein